MTAAMEMELEPRVRALRYKIKATSCESPSQMATHVLDSVLRTHWSTATNIKEWILLELEVVTGKGHETYQIEGDKKEFFDDREECREALHYVDELHQAGIDTSEFPWRLPESH